MGYDLVLSSGFLALGSQAGFLAAVEELDLQVEAVCGTSSGALVSALWASGMPAREALAVAAARSPLRLARPSARPWRGLLSMRGIIGELARYLPPRIEDLDRPFAVGVIDRRGEHVLLDAGPLPESVAASCAMPYIFEPVTVSGREYADGGARDRTALSPWLARRGAANVLLHLVERSHGAAEEAAIPSEVVCVRSPRSGARLWNLGPVQERFEQTRSAALTVLEQALR